MDVPDYMKSFIKKIKTQVIFHRSYNVSNGIKSTMESTMLVVKYIKINYKIIC